MRGIILKRYMVLFLTLCIFFSFTACGKKDKETVISDNVSKQIQAEDSEIKQKIELGNKYLQQDKAEEAKKTYENAISIDTGNKDTYISIKDSYMAKNRLDDAVYIIKLAIANKVDVDNMKAILESINKKFEVISFQNTVYQKDSITLPKETTIKINNETELKVPIKWKDAAVNTSKTGTFTYEGVIEQYERNVRFILTVKLKPIVKEKKIGFIAEVYESSGKHYLKFDEVQFFMGDKAIEEAKKDGRAFVDENGKYYVEDDYYMRNVSNKITVYEIADDAPVSLLAWQLGLDGNAAVTKQVPYQQFKDRVNSDSAKGSNTLFWIDTENDKIVKIEAQYRP